MKKIAFLLILLILLLYVVHWLTYTDPSTLPKKRGEYITRTSGENSIAFEQPLATGPQTYPWSKSSLPPITKEHFRCKGSLLNPPKALSNGEKHFDCGGKRSHGLPYRDGDEFIFPVLIELLNAVQSSLNKKVIITCGHCCPQHSHYIHNEGTHLHSKHQIGAEVDFYVEGVSPYKVVQILREHYESDNEHGPLKQGESGISWSNKEVVITLYRSDEERDFDNRHPHSYLSMQLKWDRNNKKHIVYSWPIAHKQYTRF